MQRFALREELVPVQETSQSFLKSVQSYIDSFLRHIRRIEIRVSVAPLFLPIDLPLNQVLHVYWLSFMGRKKKGKLRHRVFAYSSKSSFCSSDLVATGLHTVGGLLLSVMKEEHYEFASIKNTAGCVTTGAAASSYL